MNSKERAALAEVGGRCKKAKGALPPLAPPLGPYAPDPVNKSGDREGGCECVGKDSLPPLYPLT